jgi:Ca2+-binding RTX toxin-like protein
MATLTITGTAADDTIVITASGTDSGSYSINGGPAVAFSGVTEVMVSGEDGNDTLTIVNPDGGLFAPMDGISYDGGGDPADALEILGGTANDLTYTAGATHDAGTLTYTGDAGTQTIAFAGIAPITDTVAAATLTIFGTPSNDAIAVTDGGLVNGFQTTQVSAPTFESIRFANKTTVTIIGNGGAADTLTFNNPTPAAGLSTLNVTNVGTVTQNGAVNYTNLSLNNVTGTVTLTGSNDVTSLSALLTGAGNGFSFNDVDDVALTSVGFVNGVSTNNGAIAITTAVGPIIVANTGAGSDVNAGSSTVALTAGSFGATDFFIQLQPGANVTGLAGVQLRADNIDLTTGATVNAGSTTATLNAFTPATVIDLGGADTANTLGLTDAELDGITAGVLRIGDLTSGRIRFSDAITPGGIAQLELTTGADIQDNHFGPDVTVVSLAMTAGTGIGTASSALGTTVAEIEAQTNTGGINISNTGGVLVGGVTGSLTGLRVVTSGDLSFSAAGTITLQDTDGVEIVAGGSASGNVLLSATGAGADVTAAVNKDAITASAGSITVAAGRNILLGTVGADFDNDVRANGSVTLSAGLDLVVDGSANIISDAFGNSTGGGVIATVGDDIEVTSFHGTDAFIAASGTAGADVTLTTGANGALTLTSGPLAVFSNSGDVTVNADVAVIFSTSGISAPGPGQNVTIQPVSATWAINLGSTNEGTLELSDVELDRIFAPTIRIGSTSNPGNITVSSPITLAGGTTLSLRTGGGIIAGTAGAQTDITVDNLALRAASGIGIADIFNVAVSNLAFNNSGMGDININDAGGLTLGAVDGLASSSNAGGIAQVATAGGPLTVAANITTSGFLNLGAGDTAPAGDNLTVLAGVTIRSTGGSVQLIAGDDVTTQAGSTIQSADTLFVHVDSSIVDAGVGGTDNLNGVILAGAIEITGNPDNDTLRGTPFADLLDGFTGADLMIGGGGNDSYRVDNAGDAVIENAAEGTDTVFSATHFALPANVENLTMQSFSDLQAYGNALANTMVGGFGSDLLDGSAGADVMLGGVGNDTYFVDNAGDIAIEIPGEGNDTVFATTHFALPANVENLVLQGSADLQGYGNSQPNSIFGNSGNNLIDGGGDADVMSGGIGNDTYFVDNTGDAVVENAGQGNDAVFASVNYGLSANVETLILQGGADLQGYGNGLVNVIYGNTGNNLLNGFAGADLMVGGAGNDTYFVDDTSDAAFELPGQGSDAVFASAHYGLAADVETLVLQGTADFQGYGNNQANTLFGNSGNNLLNGAGGADTMYGGFGNDTYFVDNGLDQVTENPLAGTDAVFSTVHFILPTNVETLVLQGSAAANGTGNSLANSIFGNSGDNMLDGQGNADTLTGNAGNDTFVFIVGQGNGDTVVDFAGNGAAAGDSLRFVGYGAGASFTGIDATHWQVNYNGGSSHEIITFMNGAPIDASDVVFV